MKESALHIVYITTFDYPAFMTDKRLIVVAGVPITIGIVLFLLINISTPRDNNQQQSEATTIQKPVFVKTLNLDPRVTNETIIPPVDYDTRGYQGVGKQYPPTNVANKCLFYFSHVRNATAWEYGVYTAEWLQAHSTTNSKGYIMFTNNFTWPPYNLTAGWKSAASQATASDCFLKAYSYTNQTIFLTDAKNSLMFLQVPIDQGGVLVDEGNNKYWYEGYAGNATRVPQALVSHQSTLLSLANYLAIDRNATIQTLFDNGLQALKADALLYDRGNNTSLFDREGNPSGSLHQTYITNFQKLYDITKDEKLLAIKQKFIE